MEERPGRPTHYPWINALLIVVIALFGFIFIGPALGLLVAYPFYEGTAFTFLTDLENPVGKDHMKLPLMIVQGLATFIGLGIVPAYYYSWSTARRESVFGFFTQRRITLITILLTTFVVFSFLVFNTIFIEWNANIDLPDFMSGFEEAVRAWEDKATALTKFLTTFATPGEFIIGFIVIAVLPSICEELVFRGLLQSELHRATNNIHAAIWISAILFSALHLQFFGFLPRVLLGALFGYLYYWSGNFLVPVLGHFLNNGFGVLMIYFNKTTVGGIDLESSDAAPWPAVVAFGIMTAVLMYYFRRIHSAKPVHP